MQMTNKLCNSVEDRSGIIRVLVMLDKIIFNVSIYIGVICMTVMSVSILVGVVMRFLLKMPNMWGEEISRYLMVLGVYFGVACGCRTKSHLAVEGFVGKLPPKFRKIVQVFSKLVIIMAFAVFTYLIFNMLNTQFYMGQSSPAMRMPMCIIYTGLVVGFLFSFLMEIIVFINDFLVKKQFLSDISK
jgi:TRAP-type C4-dicarboxylate transport system permease small subunit